MGKPISIEISEKMVVESVRIELETDARKGNMYVVFFVFVFLITGEKVAKLQRPQWAVVAVLHADEESLFMAHFLP